MKESDYQPSAMEQGDSPLYPLDVMEAEQREYEAEGRIDDAYERGVTYDEILKGLGGFAEAERVVGTDYARYLQEMAFEEQQADKEKTNG